MIRETEVILDKPRMIRLGHNSIAKVYEKFGVSIDTIYGEMTGAVSEDPTKFKMTEFSIALAKLLWAGLIYTEPNLSLEDVRNMMDMAPDLPSVESKVIDAYLEMLHGWAGKGAQGEQEKKAPGTEPPA